jgi:HAD superfamily hydrolase (TIGR01509 family)
MTGNGPAAWHNILFDFDGTLVDSSPLHAEAYRRTLENHRADLLGCFNYDRLKGKTTEDGFKSLGIADMETVGLLTAAKRRFFRDAVLEGRLATLPGAYELLSALAATGRRLFLVTSGSRASVSASLRACELATKFEGIIAAEDVDHGKPSPDGFLLCLRRFGLAAAASVVIEDAAGGIAAARAAGLAVSAVHNAALIGQADFYCPDLWALRKWLAVPLLKPGAAS